MKKLVLGGAVLALLLAVPAMVWACGCHGAQAAADIISTLGGTNNWYQGGDSTTLHGDYRNDARTNSGFQVYGRQRGSDYGSNLYGSTGNGDRRRYEITITSPLGDSVTFMVYWTDMNGGGDIEWYLRTVGVDYINAWLQNGPSASGTTDFEG